MVVNISLKKITLCREVVAKRHRENLSQKKQKNKKKKFVVNDFVQLSANLRGLSFLRQVVLM